MTEQHLHAAAAREHPEPDELVALALGDVGEHERDRVAHHLSVCERCRADYAALADAVEHVLAAAPQVAPSPGFESAVLARMGVATAVPPARGRSWLHRLRPRRLLVPAVAAVAGLALGVAAATAVLGSSERGVLQPGAGDGSVLAAAGPGLVTGDGERVGTVLESWFDGRPVLVVSVSAARPGARYACELVLADGSRRPAGSWVLDGTAATWVVQRPEDAPVTGVELVAPTGRTWAAASF